jgi:hypothetical protein
MKKIFYLLISLLAYACNPYEIEVNYDDEKGYLTDVESVRYGLQGWWLLDDGYKIHYEGYNHAYSSLLVDTYIVDSYHISYAIYKSGDKFILQINQISRVSQISPVGYITNLEKDLENARKENNQEEIRRLEAALEHILMIEEIRRVCSEKPIPDTPMYIEIIRLDKSTLIVNNNGREYTRTKIL